MMTRLTLELHRQIEPHLKRIESLLPDEYRLTLVVRHTAMPEGKNADIILTLDDPHEVVRAIERLCGDKATRARTTEAVTEGGR